MPRFPNLFPGDQETARRFFRKRSGSPSGRRASTATLVLLQTGTACVSNLRPSEVRVMMRLRRSAGSTLILSKARRCNGLRAAVNVVRSIPSSDATAPMSGGSGRFRDIISENCPLVSPIGRSASSKRRASALAARCTWRQRQASRTISVVANAGFVPIAIPR
jgi:hypothetical protein